MVNVFVKHFARGGGIMEYNIFILTWLNKGTLLGRGLLPFVEFTDPGGSPVWNPLLGFTCGQGGVAGARHSSRACLGCAEIVFL